MPLKRIKRILTSKSFLGSLMFAGALWGYTSLNHTYLTNVKLPLSVVLPSNRAFEQSMDSTIMVSVRGTGWQLFNLLFFNTSAKCVVDLSNTSWASDEFEINRTEILKGLKDIINIEFRDISPEKIAIKTGLIAQKKVPIVPNVNIIPVDGFTIVGNIEIEPDSVLIAGNVNILRTIKQWETDFAVIEDRSMPFTVRQRLKDTLSKIIVLKESYVDLTVDIQQEAEVTFYDLNYRINGGVLPKFHRLEPTMINVTVKGGIDIISRLTDKDLDVSINFRDIITDSTGLIKPIVTVPFEVEAVNISPPLVYHDIILESNRPVKKFSNGFILSQK